MLAGNKRADSSDCQLWFIPNSMKRIYGKYACAACQLLLKSMRQSMKKAKRRASLLKKMPPKTPIAFMTPKTKGKFLSRKRAQLFKIKGMINSQEKYIAV